MPRAANGHGRFIEFSGLLRPLLLNFNFYLNKNTMRKIFFKNDSRVIKCRFPTRCKETGEEIKKGESAVYYPLEKGIYSLSSKQAQEFLEWEADLQMGNNY